MGLLTAAGYLVAKEGLSAWGYSRGGSGQCASPPTTPFTMQLPIMPQKQPISVKNLTCRQYANLPDDVRPLVAGWVRGFYYRESWRDSWLLDVDRARAAFTALNEACKRSPGASFRYKLGEVAKQIEAAKP